MSIRTTIYTFAMATLVIGGSLPAMADIILLTNGGRIKGTLLNKDQSPRKTYVIQTSKGGRITLSASQVSKVIGHSESQRDYQQRLKTMPDTARGHWKMAQWCVQNKLRKQQTFHLEKTIEHDPDHREARLALGFTEHDGSWLTKAQLMEQRGFVKYKGKWRLFQDVEVEKTREQFLKAENDWKKKLRRWRGWLDSKRRYQEGLDNINNIDDPLAAKALDELLAKESAVEARLLYVDVLSKLDSSMAVDALILSAMEDVDETVRDNCLEALKKQGSKRAVGALIRYLPSKDNQIINQAGLGLMRLADPDAILPLIDALVTTHRYVLKSGNPGGIGASFGSGGTGLSSGGGKKVITKVLENQQVLDALLEITKDEKVNFRFNKNRWKRWYAQRGVPLNANLRRDE